MSRIVLAALMLIACATARAATQRDSVEFWTRQLTASDPEAREAAARGLELSGRRSLPALGALVSALGDSVAPVREAACAAIGVLGSDAAPASARLAELLARDPDPAVRAAAAAALIDVGHAAVSALPQLLAALSSPHDEARAAAAEVIGRVARGSGKEKDVIGPLEHVLLRDESRKVRAAARASLERLGRDEADLAPLFIRGLEDPDPGVRERAADWLADSPETSKPAAPRLAALAMHDESKEVRHAATDALSALGEDASAVVPTLLGELGSADADSKARAAKLLGYVGSGSEREMKALVQTAVFDRQIAVRHAARGAIVRLAGSHPLVVTDLAKLVASDDEDVAREAAETLGVLGDDAGAASPALGRAATDAAEPVRHASILALGQIGRNAASELPQLELATEDRSSRVKAAARRAIAAIHADQARQAVP